ncbi:MAG TPA: hypothetical protein VF929_11845 [Gemmatimonadaceae bacterium]
MVEPPGPVAVKETVYVPPWFTPAVKKIHALLVAFAPNACVAGHGLQDASPPQLTLYVTVWPDGALLDTLNESRPLPRYGTLAGEFAGGPAITLGGSGGGLLITDTRTVSDADSEAPGADADAVKLRATGELVGDRGKYVTDTF